mgnify:CR=1 FL=1
MIYFRLLYDLLHVIRSVLHRGASISDELLFLFWVGWVGEREPRTL